MIFFLIFKFEISRFCQAASNTELADIKIIIFVQKNLRILLKTFQFVMSLNYN